MPMFQVFKAFLQSFFFSKSCSCAVCCLKFVCYFSFFLHWLLTVILKQHLQVEGNEVPLHTLLAAPTEMLNFCVPVLVVLVLRMVLVRSLVLALRGCSETRCLAGLRADHVFGGAFVDDVRLVTVGCTVVVTLGQMLRQRRDQVLVLRHADQT